MSDHNEMMKMFSYPHIDKSNNPTNLQSLGAKIPPTSLLFISEMIFFSQFNKLETNKFRDHHIETKLDAI